MKKYKYLLFDNDGTLMDFIKAEEFALEKAYKESDAEKIVPYSKEVLKLYSEINDSWWKKLERKECTKKELQVNRFRDFLLALNIKDVDPIILSESYPKALSFGHFLFEGAEELIRKLSAEYKIEIITNGIGFVQKKRITECSYYQYIDKIFISEDLNSTKPEKEYFDKVLSIIGAKKEECLIIGDSLTADIKGGINIGIDTVWFNPLNSVNKTDVIPTYICENYTDIIKLLL